GVEESDAPNPPAAAGFRELVDVERQMRAVEAAHPDMHDSRSEGCAVVARYGDAATFDSLEVRRREPERHVANVPGSPLTNSNGVIDSDAGPTSLPQQIRTTFGQYASNS